MSRRSMFNITNAIDMYKESKDIENALNKKNKKMNEDIKSYMLSNNMECVSSEKYTATVKHTIKESLNEKLAIEIIKENLGGALLSSVIKQKEYIDEDALEKLVYNGDFDIRKLTKAKLVTDVYTLRVGKRKED